MIATPGAFLDQLEAAADGASTEEQRFRREAAVRIAAMEQARAFAFRKLNLMRAVLQAVAGAEGPEIAVARGAAVLRDKLGWATGDSEPRAAVLKQFAPVSVAVLEDRDPKSAPADVLDALAAFEQWYVATHAKPFWSLFDQYVPETPLVDF